MKNTKYFLVWILITAAFIGPGTVTTASLAGTEFKFSLLWTVIFATFACFLIQEAAAHITIREKKNILLVMADLFPFKQGAILLAGSIIVGCIAYQAGNLVGAAEGTELFLEGGRLWTIPLLTIFVSLLLFSGSHHSISKIMMALVALMGLAFIALAFGRESNSEALISGIIPKIPAGAETLSLGLLGTTIVPYNIFLGSAISKGQTTKTMRLGLFISVVFGGIITACILINGTSIDPPFDFMKLNNSITELTGPSFSYLLPLGLFAAGFTSSVTAPLAAAQLMQTVKPESKNVYTLTWLLVLIFGATFGLLGIKPVPLIVLAQALNGLLLPFLGSALWLLVQKYYRVYEAEKKSLNWINLSYLLLFGVLVVGLIYMGFSAIQRFVLNYFDYVINSNLIWLGTIITWIIVSIGIIIRQKRV